MTFAALEALCSRSRGVVRAAGSERSLILDPLAGHAPARTHISDPTFAER
jgi:hypothetical protein